MGRAVNSLMQLWRRSGRLPGALPEQYDLAAAPGRQQVGLAADQAPNGQDNDESANRGNGHHQRHAGAG